jgi:hypothetical protein
MRKPVLSSGENLTHEYLVDVVFDSLTDKVSETPVK